MPLRRLSVGKIVLPPEVTRAEIAALQRTVEGLRSDLVRDPRVTPGDTGRRAPSAVTETLFPTTVTASVSHAHSASVYEHKVTTHTWTHDLGRPAIVAAALTAIANEVSGLRFVGVYVSVNDATTLTVRVVSTNLNHGSPVTLTATLEVSWW